MLFIIHFRPDRGLKLFLLVSITILSFFISNIASSIIYFVYIYRNLKQMTTNLDEIYFVDPWELQNKLGQILVTLQYENEQFKKYYMTKIKDLNIQLTKKDHQLTEMKSSLSCLQKRYQELQWKILEKDNIIEDYHNKYKNVQGAVLDRVRNVIDNIDVVGLEESSISGKKSSDTSKRINISQYFIKSVQVSKASSKLEGSTKYDTDNQSLGVKSVESSSLIYPITNLLKNQSDPSGKAFRKMTSQYLNEQINGQFTERTQNKKPQQPKLHSKKIIKLLEQEQRKQRKQNYRQKLQEYSKNISKLRQKRNTKKRQSLLQQNWKKISMFEGKNIQNNNIMQYK